MIPSRVFEDIRVQLGLRFPDAEIESSLLGGGLNYLRVELNGVRLVLSFRPGVGYGFWRILDDADGWRAKPDITFSAIEEAVSLLECELEKVAHSEEEEA